MPPTSSRIMPLELSALSRWPLRACWLLACRRRAGVSPMPLLLLAQPHQLATHIPWRSFPPPGAPLTSAAAAPWRSGASSDSAPCQRADLKPAGGLPDAGHCGPWQALCMASDYDDPTEKTQQTRIARRRGRPDRGRACRGFCGGPWPGGAM